MSPDEHLTVHPIAHIRSAFTSKFGVPRQSNLVPQVTGTITFTQPYRLPAAVSGLEGFSHLWLIWDFSLSHREGWFPTVRPPRLGGQERMGVFATRSPFRPNPLGLSSVALAGVELTGPDGPQLHVAGTDLVDGTPIFDIKPYIPTDVHADARFGFVTSHPDVGYSVQDPADLLSRLPCDLREGLKGVLGQDPRPSFLDDPTRVYAMPFGGWDVRFRVVGRTVRVVDLVRLGDPPTHPDAAAQDRRDRWPGYDR